MLKMPALILDLARGKTGGTESPPGSPAGPAHLDYGRADRGSEILNTPANSRSGELRCHRFRSHGCTVGIPEKWLVMEHLIHTAGRFYE